MKFMAGFLLFAIASKALACSCVSLSEEELVSKADRIFLGVVEKTEIVRPESEEDWPYVSFALSVKDLVKGKAKAVEKLRTGFGGGDCGIPIVTGRAYIIFLGEGQDFAGICGGSRNVLRFEEEEYVSQLKALSKSSNK